MGDAVLSREEIDRALEKVTDDNDRIAESLVAMDGHPGHQLLRNAALAGLTATRWAEASAAMATLWEQFARYRALVDRAKEVRARRARPGEDELAELTELLSGQVVELDSQAIPIEHRGLTGPSEVTERITLTELLARMRAAFDMVTDVLATAETAWSTAVARLDPLDKRVHAVSVLAESVASGDRDVTAEVNGLRRGLDRTRELVLTDVLTARATDAVNGIVRQLDKLESDLSELARVRDEFGGRLTALESTLSDIEAAEATARQTYAAVRDKIASPGLPEPSGQASAALRARLGRLVAQRESVSWAQLAREADELDRVAFTTLDAARTALRAITGLLDRRAELRGRLEAYQVKAARLGHAEDRPLEELHTEAHNLLFTAPCDLPAATRALNRYLKAIQERERPSSREEGTE